MSIIKYQAEAKLLPTAMSDYKEEFEVALSLTMDRRHYNLALVQCRRTLEQLLIEVWKLKTGVKNPGDITLKTAMDQLISKKLISEELVTYCETIKIYGDKAAHLRFELPVEPLVLQALGNLLVVLKWFAREIVPIKIRDPLRSRVDALIFHAVEDTEAAQTVIDRLRAVSLEPHLVCERTPNESIKGLLGSCRIVVMLIGVGGRGAWQNEAMSGLIAEKTKLALHRVIPVRIPGGNRPELAHLPEYLRCAQWVEFGDLFEEGAIEELSIRILGAAPKLRFDPSTSDHVAPYRGLMSFNVADAPLYFGREAQIDWLMGSFEPLRDSARDNRFLALVGASGSGKSSLCLAGVVAAVQANTAGWSADWPVAICRPGREPLLNLTVALFSVPCFAAKVSDPGDLQKRLLAEPERLHITAAWSLHGAKPSVRVLVVVDQFEELFTECKDQAERMAFVNNLCHAASIRGGRTVVILTMRDDFFGRCAEFPNLTALLRCRTELVTPLNDDQLVRVIEQPALLAGCSVAPELTQSLLREMRNQPHALPLLEHLLEQIWRHRLGKELTLETYETVGGFRGALKRHADTSFASLCARDQEIARGLFIRLTRPGTVNAEAESAVIDDTKRRVAMADLYPVNGDHEVVDEVVRHLTNERLISTVCGDDRAVLVEIAHEELIRSWPMLRGWLEADRKDHRIHHDLTTTAERWVKSSRVDGYLVRGEPLESYTTWASQNPNRINKQEREFLHAAVRLTVRQAAQVDTTEWRQALADLAGLFPFSEPILREMLRENPLESRQHRLIAIALLPHDESLIDPLVEVMLQAVGVEFAMVCDALRPYSDRLIERLWSLSADAVNDGRFLRVAMALAAYNPPSGPPSVERWTLLVDRLPLCLLNDLCENPDHFASLCVGLEPVRDLVKSGIAAMSVAATNPYRKSWACRAGVAFAAGDIRLLSEMLWRAEFELIPIIWEAWKEHRPQAEDIAIAQLHSHAASIHAAGSESSRDAAATNAAVALFKFNDETLEPFTALGHSPNPQVRTNLIEWAPSIEIDYTRLWKRYRDETDVSIKRAILLAMSNYTSHVREIEQPDTVNVIREDFHTHPDPGLHSACQSLIKRRGWNIPSPVSRPAAETDRGWYVSAEGQTFVMIQGMPFLMGSRPDDADAQPNERLHRRRLHRRFALGSTQVTRAEYRRFQIATGAENITDSNYILTIVRTEDSPMTYVRWYEAAAYCNWLSRREDIAQDEWCYVPNEQGNYGPGMRFAENYLSRTGYRLPTETEWEFAARAGAETRFYFGNDSTSLRAYAWYMHTTGGAHVKPVATKLPNDFGLFDMLGNAWEWCGDRYIEYQDDMGDSIDDQPVQNEETRVLRGGAYVNVPAHVRCACRNYINKPDTRFHPLGFRVARTVPE